MILEQWVFSFYVFFGLLMIYFREKIVYYEYKFLLFYTDRLGLRELFLFKVDDTNRDSLSAFLSVFTAAFSFFLLFFAIAKVI